MIPVLGLRDLDAAKVSVSLSALFPTPVFAEPDKQPGYGFPVVPTVVFNDLFADYPSRWHEFNGIWGVTLKIKRQSNGEAFNAHLTPLTVSPLLRPGQSLEHDPKRQKKSDASARPPPPQTPSARGQPAVGEAVHVRNDGPDGPKVHAALGLPWSTRRQK